MRARLRYLDAFQRATLTAVLTPTRQSLQCRGRHLAHLKDDGRLAWWLTRTTIIYWTRHSARVSLTPTDHHLPLAALSPALIRLLKVTATMQPTRP